MVERIKPAALMSQATIWNGTAYLSGQVALDNRDGDFDTQASEILRRIDALLEAAGSDRSRLLAATIWLVRLSDFDRFNQLWADWLDGASAPARATVRGDLVLPGLLLEIQVTAASS